MLVELVDVAGRVTVVVVHVMLLLLGVATAAAATSFFPFRQVKLAVAIVSGRVLALVVGLVVFLEVKGK